MQTLVRAFCLVVCSIHLASCVQDKGMVAASGLANITIQNLNVGSYSSYTVQMQPLDAGSTFTMAPQTIQYGANAGSVNLSVPQGGYQVNLDYFDQSGHTIYGADLCPSTTKNNIVTLVAGPNNLNVTVCKNTGSQTGAPVTTAAPVSEATQSDRIVGIMYSVWHDHFATSRDSNGKPFLMSHGAPYGPNPTYNWWGEPAYGNDISDYHFMNQNDPEQPNNALIDYHADLLRAAGIDFIAIDLTNGQQDLIVKAAQAVARRYSQRDMQKTPRIVLFVQDVNAVTALQPIFFAGNYNDAIWFKYNQKPLILIGQANTAEPTGGILDKFTTRHTWGLQGSSDRWSFKLNTTPSNPGTAFYYNGKAEEMSVAAACQGTYMTASASRRGRNNGNYFAEQWGYVFATKPKFVFVTAWNEWGSQNLGDSNNPLFVDTFGEEYSADLEPMRGGHQTTYYDLLKSNVQKFKSL